jgi:hypothetical protein
LVTHKWQMLLDMRQPVDCLVLGDSSGSLGVVPSVISQRLGGASVNLCSHAGLRIVNDAWTLQAYLERFGPPKKVLLVRTIDGWTGGTPVFYNLLQIPLGWGYWNRFQPPITLAPKQYVEAFAIKYIPLYSRSVTVGSLLKTPWHTQAQPDLIFDERGWLSVPGANPEGVKSQAKSLAASYKGAQAVFDEPAVKSLEQIAALAKQFGFDVYLANGPLYEGLYESQEYLAYANQVRDWLDTFSASHERVHHILRTPKTFPADLMENVVHVIGSAAPGYTEAVVSEMLNADRPLPTSAPESAGQNK